LLDLQESAGSRSGGGVTRWTEETPNRAQMTPKSTPACSFRTPVLYPLSYEGAG